MKHFPILILLLFLSGCNGKKKEPQQIPAIVTAFQVEPQTIPATFEFVGVARSSHPVEIRARVEGYLTHIDYVEGSVVNINDLLFEIDPRPFQASLDATKGALARQKAVLWRAKRSLDRIAPLFAKNAVSQRDLDDSTASVLAAEAEVFSATANVEQASLNLSYTVITSPILGLAGRALYREGTLITPAVNGLLTTVSVIDPLWVYFSVSDNELLSGRGESEKSELILPAQDEYTVTLQLADGSLFPYSGTVNFASPTLDPQTGTMTIRATFPNPAGEVLPGQFVRAIVSGAKRPHAIFVPQESVVQGSKGQLVFVIDKNNTVAARYVEVGEWYGNYWIIKSGLQSGEIVVAEGVNKVQEGSLVQVTALLKPAAPK